MAANSGGQTAAILRRAAERHPEVEEGVACAGTAIESRTYKVGGKAFLFLGPKQARLKLIESATEMAALARKDADHFSIGAHGWAAIACDGKTPPRADLERWVDESYRALAQPAATAKRPAATAKRPAATAKRPATGKRPTRT